MADAFWTALNARAVLPFSSVSVLPTLENWTSPEIYPPPNPLPREAVEPSVSHVPADIRSPLILHDCKLHQTVSTLPGVVRERSPPMAHAVLAAPDYLHSLSIALFFRGRWEERVS